MAYYQDDNWGCLSGLAVIIYAMIIAIVAWLIIHNLR
jgi:hypothetical protein